MADIGETTSELNSARVKMEAKKLKARREQLIGDHMERYNELCDLTKTVLWQDFGKPDRDITYEDVVARLDQVLQMVMASILVMLKPQMGLGFIKRVEMTSIILQAT